MARPEPQPDAFESFLSSARKGAEFVYYVGRTVFDVATNGRIPEAQAAFDAFEAGRVSLVQRRVPNSDGLFQYVAQKR